MSILLNDNLNVSAVKPVDSRYGPWASLAVAKSGIASHKRYRGLTVGILTNPETAIVEYWFCNGVADADLIEKITSAPVGSSGGAVSTTLTYWTSESGQTEFLTITGYSGVNDASNYIVSVGAQDQIPTLHYTIESNSGAGKLILSSSPPTGTLVSLRFIVGDGVSNNTNAVKIQGVDVSSASPTNGQALVYDYATHAYKPSTVSGGTADTGDITFSGTQIKGVNSFNDAGSLELIPNPNNRYASQSLIIRPTSPNDGQHIHIDRSQFASLYLGNDNQYVKLSNDADKHIEIGVPEPLTSHAYTVEFASGSPTNGMYITKASNLWALDLTNGSTITRTSPSGTEIIIDSISTLSDPSRVYVAFRESSPTVLSVGDTVSFHYNPRKTWKFTNDGALKFPDGTTQSTAGGGGSGSGNATQIQSRNIASTPPTEGQTIVWDNANATWKPGSISISGGNATSLQGRNVASSAPTDGQILTWNPTTSTWVATTIVSGGSVTFNTVGVHNWTVPITARWVRVQATSGAGTGGTNGADGDSGGMVTVSSPPSQDPDTLEWTPEVLASGVQGNDGGDGVDGVDGKSVKIFTTVVASGGAKGLKGYGGGGGGGAGCMGFVHPDLGYNSSAVSASAGRAGRGTNSGGGGSAGNGSDAYSAVSDGAAGGAGDGAAGGAGGISGVTWYFASSHGGAGGAASLSTRAGGGGGGGGYNHDGLSNNSTGGVGGYGGLGSAGTAGVSVDIPFNLTSYVGTVIPIEIVDGGGSASITISW